MDVNGICKPTIYIYIHRKSISYSERMFMAAKPIVNNYPIQIYTDYEYSYEVIMGSIRLYQPPDRSIHQTMDE